MTYEVFGSNLENPENWIAFAEVYDGLQQMNSRHSENFDNDEMRLKQFITENPTLGGEFLTYLSNQEAASVRHYAVTISDHYAVTHPDLTIDVMTKGLNDNEIREESASYVSDFLSSLRYAREVRALGIPRLHKLMTALKAAQTELERVTNGENPNALKLPTDQELGQEIVFGLKSDSLDMIETVVSMEERGEGYLVQPEVLEGLSEREMKLAIARDALLSGDSVATKLFGINVAIVPDYSGFQPPSDPDNGDPSGDREPRVPVVPDRAGSAALRQPGEQLFRTERHVQPVSED